MKKAGTNIIWNVLLILLSVSLIILGIFSGNELCTSLGTLMTIVLGIKLVRLSLRFRNEESRKKYEEEINDERTNLIAGKAALSAYIALEFTLLAFLLYCVIMKIEVLLSPISLVMGIGLVVYLIVYYTLDHKM